MGLFNRKPKESYEEIKTRIQNSEAANTFLNYFANELSPEGDWYNYLIADTKERNITLSFEKRGVGVEITNWRDRKNYIQESTGIGFGACGYADLPNSNYVMAFYSYIKDSIPKLCSHVDVKEYSGEWKIILKIKESAKTGW